MYGDAVFVGPAGRHGPRRYRYLLWRCWEPDADQLTFVLCNPSTAGGWEGGALRSDPTVDRLIEIAARAGAGGSARANRGAPRWAPCPGPSSKGRTTPPISSSYWPWPTGWWWGGAPAPDSSPSAGRWPASSGIGRGGASVSTGSRAHRGPRGGAGLRGGP